MSWMIRWLIRRRASKRQQAIVQLLESMQHEKTARIRDIPEGDPTIETFTFSAYDEGGMRIGPTGARRLVCVADSNAKVVIFGREWDLENINAVLEAGLPCTVRCETHPASRSVKRSFGHTHWVWEYSMLEVANSRLDEKTREPRGANVQPAGFSEPWCSRSRQSSTDPTGNQSV